MAQWSFFFNVIFPFTFLCIQSFQIFASSEIHFFPVQYSGVRFCENLYNYLIQWICLDKIIIV